jgi:hypothetical protein
MTSLIDIKVVIKRIFDIHAVSVFAFGTSLMRFSNSSRNLIIYDLVMGSWDYALPQNPMGYAPNDHLSWVYGKQMNLLLPDMLQ